MNTEQTKSRLWSSRLRRQSLGRASVALLLTAGLLGAWAGTSSSASPARSSSSPVSGGHLVFARIADIETLDPTVAVDNPSIWADEQIFQTLYAVAANGQGTVPWLATGYTLSANRLTWTFTLRKGVEFSNGQLLTATDVKFSINRARVSKEGLGYIDANIASVSAPSANTVVIKTVRPWAPLLADLALYVNGIIPNNFGGKSVNAFFQDPVGTGPFEFGTWVRGQSLTLVRNPHYWQPGKPYLDSVEFSVAPNANSRLLTLEGGQAQIVDAPPAPAVATLNASSNLEAAIFPSTEIVVALPNERYAPMADVHVREAIAYAIDQNAIVRAVLLGRGSRANSILPSGVPYYNPHNPGINYNLSKAKAELAESHYPHGFKLAFLTDSDYAEVAEVVQQELAPLGIKVSITTVPSSDLFVEQQQFNYQLSIDDWTMDISDPSEYATYALDGTGGSFSFFTNYNNSRMSTLVEDAATTLNTTQRARLYDEIQTYADQQLPQIPLYYAPLIYGVSKSVHDFTVTPLGNYPLQNVWMSK
jgi:peptide/nickel transport system substrate-binding protein